MQASLLCREFYNDGWSGFLTMAACPGSGRPVTLRTEAAEFRSNAGAAKSAMGCPCFCEGRRAIQAKKAYALFSPGFAQT